MSVNKTPKTEQKNSELEIGGCEIVKVPPNREMLCKRCEHVSECECNVNREGVALVVRSF